MGLFSSWGKKEEEAPKRPELNKIISTKRMTFGEVKNMLEKDNLRFDKSGLTYNKDKPQASYFSLTRGTSNETVVERIHDRTLDAKFNDARAKEKGESNTILPTEDPRRCWKPPVDFFRVLKLEERMPGYKSVPEPEGKEKINTPPVGSTDSQPLFPSEENADSPWN